MSALVITGLLFAAFLWTTAPGFIAYAACRVIWRDDRYHAAEELALALGALAFVPWSLFGLWLVALCLAVYAI